MAIPILKAGFSNNMSKVLGKVEWNLGIQTLNLDNTEIGKNKWKDTIIDISLLTYSRFFPKKILYHVDDRTFRRGSTLYLDEGFVDNNHILGVQDLDWTTLAQCFGVYDVGGLSPSVVYPSITGSNAMYSPEEVMAMQARADANSLVGVNVFVQYEAPNMVHINGISGGNLVEMLKDFNLNILVKHDPTLVTIEQTKMETFEELCSSDVAKFILDHLKYIENNDVVFAQINLHLDDLRQWVDKKDGIVAKLEEGYVNPANPATPLVITF